MRCYPAMSSVILVTLLILFTTQVSAKNNLQDLDYQRPEMKDASINQVIDKKVTQKKANISNPPIDVLPNVSKAARADLIVKQVNINPGIPTQNVDLATIYVTVKNVGGTRTSEKCSLNMSVWSVDMNGEQISGQTSLSNIIPGYTYNIPKLDSGMEVVISKELTFQFFGRHKVYGVINTESLSVGEEKSQNNLYEKLFIVKFPPPDLVVCFKKGNVSKAGQYSYYSPVIKNIGLGPSGPANLRFWIKDKGVKNYGVPPLSPGEVHTGIQRKVFWALKGTHRFSLHVDNREEVYEHLGESNNIIRGHICVTPALPLSFSECGVINTETLCSDAPGMADE